MKPRYLSTPRQPETERGRLVYTTSTPEQRQAETQRLITNTITAATAHYDQKEEPDTMNTAPTRKAPAKKRKRPRSRLPYGWLRHTVAAAAKKHAEVTGTRDFSPYDIVQHMDADDVATITNAYREAATSVVNKTIVSWINKPSDELAMARTGRVSQGAKPFTYTGELGNEPGTAVFGMLHLEHVGYSIDSEPLFFDPLTYMVGTLKFVPVNSKK